MLFLNAYFIIKSQGRSSSIKGTPLKQASVIASQKNAPLPSKASENENKQIDELDEIAMKLEQVSHKFGRPVAGHLPVPLESDELNYDFPSIQLVRNDQMDSLSRLPPALQELCIIEDLLFLVLVSDFFILDFHLFSFRILMVSISRIIKILQVSDMLFLWMKVLILAF